MLIFVKKMTCLTVQQGKNQDTKVNKKRVFLWLGDRMCSKVVNSECFNQKNTKKLRFDGLLCQKLLVGLDSIKKHHFL